MIAFHVSDLHGSKERFEILASQLRQEKPQMLFIGGDLYPSFKEMRRSERDFFSDFFVPYFQQLKNELQSEYPKVFIILGNDDPKTEEIKFQSDNCRELWTYLNTSKSHFNGFDIYGYPYIPPTPFIYKDWELYDVSRYVDPGCVHPTEGKRSVDPGRDVEFSSIKKDLEALTTGQDLSNAIFLFHSPPYKTNLDRAALDNMFFDHIPLDVNIGSIAIREFIEEKQPLISLHGHVHESTRLTGDWKEKLNNTYCFNAASEQNKFSIVIFEPKSLHEAKLKTFEYGE